MASQINPNNINGNYPVAGQDNNSQGFRDNFTNTRVNFQFAEDEINDLQNKVLLKAPLTGQALDNNMNNNLLLAARIQAFSATKVDVTLASNVYTLNYAAGHYQTFSTTTSVSELAFSNFPPSGTYGYYKIQVEITNVNHVLQIPAAVSLGLEGIQGISPGVSGVTNTISFNQTGYYEFGFGTYDGGTTITLFDLNRALTNFTGGTLAVENLTASNSVSAAGNVTGGNILTGGVISADGTVTGGNVITGGTVSAGGNIVAANFNALGQVTGQITGRLRPAAPTSGAAGNSPLRFTAGAALLATPVSGAIEYDGKVLYGTPVDNQRGYLNTSFMRVTNSNHTLIDTAVAQDVFPVPTSINLAADTTYEMEAMYLIYRTSGTNTHYISTLFALGGTLISISYVADMTQSGGFPVLNSMFRNFGNSASPLIVSGSYSSAVEFNAVTLKGIIRTDTAGDLTPQIQYNSAPGGAPQILAGSYFRLIPVGSGTVTQVGEWA